MNPPIRPSERIRRSVIVPIQMGGSFLISLTSPLVSMASRMMGGSRKPRENPPSRPASPAASDQPMEIKLSKKPDQSGPGQSR